MVAKLFSIVLVPWICGIPIARDFLSRALSRALFACLIVIHSFNPRWSFDFVVNPSYYTPSAPLRPRRAGVRCFYTSLKIPCAI